MNKLEQKLKIVIMILVIIGLAGAIIWKIEEVVGQRLCFIRTYETMVEQNFDKALSSTTMSNMESICRKGYLVDVF